MNKRNNLQKLQALRDVEQLEKGFPDKRSCLDWAAKVEPLLRFNLTYQINFSAHLGVLHRNISGELSASYLDELVTILEKAIRELEYDLESEEYHEPLKVANPMGDYVNQDRIKKLASISSVKFDLSKLVQLCKELNSCHREGNCFAIIMLCRSIIDHVPPVFGCNNFNEVVNNYRSPKSFKESAKKLNESSRNIADQHLHTMIRNRESLPNMTQVDFSNDLDVLLSEIVRILK
jgi:hypothetical protein